MTECAGRTLGWGRFASRRSYHEPARWSVIAPGLFSTSNGEKCPLLLLVSTGRLAHNEKPRFAPADVSRPTVTLVPLDLCGTSYRPSAICIQRASDARRLRCCISADLVGLPLQRRLGWFLSVCKHGCAASRQTPPAPRLQFSRGSPGWLRCVTAMMCVSEGCQSLCQESTHVRRHWLRCNSPAQIQLTFLFFSRRQGNKRVLAASW